MKKQLIYYMLTVSSFIYGRIQANMVCKILSIFGRKISQLNEVEFVPGFCVKELLTSVVQRIHQSVRCEINVRLWTM